MAKDKKTNKVSSEEPIFAFDLEFVESELNKEESPEEQIEHQQLNDRDVEAVPVPRFLPHRVWSANKAKKPTGQLALPPVSEKEEKPPTEKQEIASSAVKKQQKSKRSKLPSREKTEKVKSKEKSFSELEKERLAREKRRQQRLKKDEKKRNKEQEKQEKRRQREERKEARHQKRRQKRDLQRRKRRQTTTAEQAQRRKQGMAIVAFIEKQPWIGPKIKAYRQKENAKQGKPAKPKITNKIKQSISGFRAEHSRRLGKNIVGLEIGASTLRAVLLEDDFVVLEHKLPEGIIVDGFLEEPEELSKEIKEFWRQQKIKSKKVNFSLSNRLLTLVTTQLAAKKDSDVAQVLGLQADLLLAPMDADKTIIDYSELSRSGPNRSLQVAAADKDMVSKYAKAIEKAGLLSVSCEIAALASSRALRIPYSARDSHLIVDIGQETTSITAASGTDVFYFRNLDIGGSDFTAAIKNSMQCDWLTAEKLKKQTGIGQRPASDEIDSATFKKCRGAMRLVSDQLAQEIEQTKLFWERSDNGRPVSSWTILGGGSLLSGLQEQIAFFTGLENPLPLTPYPGLEADNNLLTHATALGLARERTMSLLPASDAFNFNIAIPGMRRRSKISLQRSRRQAKRLAQGQREQVVSPKLVAVALSLAALAGGYYYNYQQQDSISDLKTRVDNINSTQRQFTVYAPPKYSNSAPASKLANFLYDQPDFNKVSEISKKILASNLKNIRISNEGPVTNISARAEDETDVEQVRQDLNNISGLNGVRIESSPVGEQINLQIEVATGPTLNLRSENNE